MKRKEIERSLRHYLLVGNPRGISSERCRCAHNRRRRVLLYVMHHKGYWLMAHVMCVHGVLVSTFYFM